MPIRTHIYRMKYYDKIIIGAGIYGLYAAIYCGRKGQKVLVLEKELEAFTRATYVNQARVHNGYHYPRSYSTAKKSAGYFERFIKEYPECVLQDFEQIYATSKLFSWTDAKQFKKFCDNVGVYCEQIDVERFFNKNMCDGAFKTQEYTYDSMVLKKIMLKEIQDISNIEILYGSEINSINKDEESYILKVDGENYYTGYLLNCTYASTNQILDMVGYDKMRIKYELCEIIICSVDDLLKNVGITVMDGPFFSIMPFGKTGYHSLTSVTFTPHTVCNKELPEFECQKKSEGFCNSKVLGNCNLCENKPESAWIYMSNLAHKYMKKQLLFDYKYSLYSMKAVLSASEVDDSRPTVIKEYSKEPYFYSVLSGKINTIYDLEDIL